MGAVEVVVVQRTVAQNRDSHVQTSTLQLLARTATAWLVRTHVVSHMQLAL